MKYYIKLGSILLITCAIAAGVLAYINGLTAPKIAAVKQAEAEKARLEVMVDDQLTAENIKFDKKFLDVDVKGDSIFYYIASMKDADQAVGYILTAAKYGYSSNVKTVVGLTADFKIKKIKVIDQAETPGLGAKCVNPDFAPRFKDLAVDALKVDKDGGSIKSITGATITTRTVANSIKESMQKLLEKESK
jgi:electron transport complex protein RnfG